MPSFSFWLPDLLGFAVARADPDAAPLPGLLLGYRPQHNQVI
jgi:hypothetical protein